MNDLKDKKLLILAGVDVHVKLVRAAKALGVYTIVTDYLLPEESPAKLVADEYWMLNITDIDSIVKNAVNIMLMECWLIVSIQLRFHINKYAKNLSCHVMALSGNLR